MTNQNIIISFIVFAAIVLGAFLWFNKDRANEPVIPAVVNTSTENLAEVVVTQTTPDTSTGDQAVQPVDTKPGFPQTGYASFGESI
jgi:hypothetical protein